MCGLSLLIVVGFCCSAVFVFVADCIPIMKIPFVKMHGAGNDFIVVNDWALTFPLDDRAFMAKICTRRTGIGSDGILLIQPSECADVRMRFINPDGGEASMCGNGARCFARRAFELGFAPETMKIETAAGMVSAEILGEQVRLVMTDPTDWRMGLDAGTTAPVDFVNTGVPHAVLRVENVAEINVAALGRSLRYHSLFAPGGTNVDFVQVLPDRTLQLRTYERGVEAETLACGTGAVATALVAAKHGWVDLPVAVHCAGGYDLVVDSAGGAALLTGNAITVFEGEVEYGDRV